MKLYVGVGKKYITISEALDAASDGDEIVVASGKYTESLLISKKITLHGEGDAPVLSAPNNCCVKIISDKVEINGFSFEDNAVAIFIESGTAVRLINNIFSESLICAVFCGGTSRIAFYDDIVGDNLGSGLIIDENSSVNMRKTHITKNQGDGVLVCNTAHVEIEECVIEGSGLSGIVAIENGEVVSRDNTFKQNSNWDFFFEDDASLTLIEKSDAISKKSLFAESAVLRREPYSVASAPLPDPSPVPAAQPSQQPAPFASNVVQLYSKNFNNTYYVKNLIGKGGQGEVYLVENDKGVAFAFKRYFSDTAGSRLKSQRKTIKRLLSIGAPSVSFLWPFDIIDLPADHTFGYVMLLRDNAYVPVNKVCSTYEAPPIIASVIYNLADNFLALHNKNLAYRDISASNMFYNPKNGLIQICDNDNVAVDGKRASVRGTEMFMAPEIVLDQADPSKNTDRYSLAVLFFRILFKVHPLVGEATKNIDKKNQAAVKEAFGQSPVFVFDEQDNSNGPVAGMHDAAFLLWERMPISLRKLFSRSFTEGLKHPEKRVMESEWRLEIRHLLYSHYVCHNCGKDVCIAEEDMDLSCSYCGTKSDEYFVRANFRKRGKKKVLYSMPLFSNTVLYKYHFDSRIQTDAFEAVMKIVEHPTKPQVFGLENCGVVEPLTCSDENKTNFTTWDAHRRKPIKPGAVFTLTGGEYEFVVG